MDKIVSFIKKNYIYINITILMLIIYIILFPIIENPIKSIFPSFNECTYLKITGKPCPLCGGTRYIKNLPYMFKDITYLFHPFGIMMIIIIIDGIFRIYIILNRKKQKTDNWIKMDILIHIVILNVFFLYEFIYILMQ